MSDPILSESYLSNHPTLNQENSSKVLWIASILEPVLPSDPSADILEIGPGRGDALKYFKDVCGYKNIYAIDNSPEVAKLCRDIIGDRSVMCGDVFSILEEGDREYDLIFLFHVLEHFSAEQVVVLVSCMHQALKPGGVLVVGVPNAAAPIIGTEQQFFDFTHKTAFSPWSLEQAMKTGGFSSVTVCPIWPPGRSFGRTIQRNLQKIVLGLLRVYLRIFTGVPRPVLTHSMVAYGRKDVL